MQLLRWIELEKDAPGEGFPWQLAAVRTLDRIEFETPVTFLVGDNGTGKSTLLEGVAVAAGFNPEGGTRHLRYSARATESPLRKPSCTTSSEMTESTAELHPEAPGPSDVHVIASTGSSVNPLKLGPRRRPAAVHCLY